MIGVRDRSTSGRISGDLTVIALSAIGATISALFFAVFVGGPIARVLSGTPVGFGEHFTSNASYRQAWLVQSASVGSAFILLGFVLGRIVSRSRLAWAVLAANPITVGIGFVVFKLSYESLPLARHAIEYFNIRDGVLLALLSPFVFALCCRAGAFMSNSTPDQT